MLPADDNGKLDKYLAYFAIAIGENFAIIKSDIL
jgi:hypothetical protein